MRSIFISIILLLICHAPRAMVLEGQVKIDEDWAPVLYLSIIEDLDDLHTASYQFLIAEIRLDSSGRFRVELNGLPESDHIYRLHVCQEGDPVSTIIIGGQDENFIHFIGNAGAHVSLLRETGESAFRDTEVRSLPANESFQMLLDWKRQVQGAARIPSEQNELRLRRDLENRFGQMIDTSQNLLVRICALEFLEDISEQPPFERYRQVAGDLTKSDTSPYASQFRDRAAYLAYQAGEKHGNGALDTFSMGVAGGLVAVIMFSLLVFFKGRRTDREGVDGNGFAFDLSLLSSQERRVWKLLEQRMSNKEIAANLNIEVTTVKSHVYRIYNKLGINSRKEIWDHLETGPASRQ